MGHPPRRREAPPPLDTHMRCEVRDLEPPGQEDEEAPAGATLRWLCLDRPVRGFTAPVLSSLGLSCPDLSCPGGVRPTPVLPGPSSGSRLPRASEPRLCVGVLPLLRPGSPARPRPQPPVTDRNLLRTPVLGEATCPKAPPHLGLLARPHTPCGSHTSAWGQVAIYSFVQERSPVARVAS